MNLQSPSLERDQARLYELIWKRTIASQMSDALLERTLVKIGSNTHKELFTANGEVIKFDGFLKVYLEGKDEEDLAEIRVDELLPYEETVKMGFNLKNHPKSLGFIKAKSIHDYNSIVYTLPAEGGIPKRIT